MPCWSHKCTFKAKYTTHVEIVWCNVFRETEDWIITAKFYSYNESQWMNCDQG